MQIILWLLWGVLFATCQNPWNKRCSPSTILSLSQLQGCEIIDGSLNMIATNDSDIPIRIEEVTRCIVIRATNMTNLDWLDLADDAQGQSSCGVLNSRIENNLILCVTPRIKRIAANGYKATFENNLPEDCHFTCPGPIYKENYPRNVYQEVECHFINGTLKIFDVEANAPLIKSLEKLEEVNNGSIEINNIEHSTMDFFPVLHSISPLDDEPDIIIRNSLNLENIVLPPKLTRKLKIVVRGNGKLSQETLDKLKASAAEGSDIQPHGECGFPSQVEDTSKLDGCLSIGTDLALTKDTIKEVTQTINYVNGCITIQFTKLKNLHFLKLVDEEKTYCERQSIIEDNTELCLSPREKRLLKKLYNAVITEDKTDCGFDKHCTDGTSFADLMKDEHECAEVGGEILLTGTDFWKKSVESIKNIVGGHVIVKNTALTNLDLFSGLKKLKTAQNDDNAFVIENNAELRNIKFSSALGKMKIQVRGNKKLTQNTIDYLKREMSSDSDIQQFGECHSVNKPSDLNGCSSIYKDLNLISTQITKVDETITAVGGCIQIKNTSLKNLNFLKLKDTATVSCTGGSVIENNKDLCILPKIEKILKNVYKAAIKNNAPQDCASVCDASSLEQNYNTILSNQQTCIKLLGSLVIRNQQVPQAWFSLLKDVETIDGGNIVIENNQFADLNILPKLKNITNYSGTEPAISIRNNPNLNQFTLPALQNIEAPNAELYFKIENNPLFDYPGDISDVFSRFPPEKIDHDLRSQPISTTPPSNENNIEETSNTSNLLDYYLAVFVVLCNRTC